MAQSQPQQIVCESLSWKTLHKIGAGGVAQVQNPVLQKKRRRRRRKEALKMHFYASNVDISILF
jgi:hypothetical protein